MIAGLEFIRSWRYWAVLVVMTSAVALGSAGVHIALNLYFPVMAVESNELLSDLGAFAFAALTIGIYWFVNRGDKQEVPYPEKHEFWLMLVGGFAAASLILLVWAMVRWLIVEPIVPDAPGGGSYSSAGQIAVIIFGWWVAKKEWAAMTGAGSERKRSVIPDSP